MRNCQRVAKHTQKLAAGVYAVKSEGLTRLTMCWQLRQQADRNSTAMALLIFVNLTRAREAEPSAVRIRPALWVAPAISF